MFSSFIILTARHDKRKKAWSCDDEPLDDPISSLTCHTARTWTSTLLCKGKVGKRFWELTTNQYHHSTSNLKKSTGFAALQNTGLTNIQYYFEPSLWPAHDDYHHTKFPYKRISDSENIRTNKRISDSKNICTDINYNAERLLGPWP